MVPSEPRSRGFSITKKPAVDEIKQEFGDKEISDKITHSIPMPIASSLPKPEIIASFSPASPTKKELTGVKWTAMPKQVFAGYDKSSCLGIDLKLDPEYLPGDKITGVVTVDLSKPITHCKGVKVLFQGFEKAFLGFSFFKHTEGYILFPQKFHKISENLMKKVQITTVKCFSNIK